MTKLWARRLLNVALLLVVAAAAYWVVLHKQDILDWWKLRSYQPSSEVKAMADAATMVGRGRDMFYVSEPEVKEKEDFNSTCTDTGEKSIVLGCYKAQRIYIYNVTDAKLNGVKEVTAAHEMLHAAYERLNGQERADVNDMLQVQLANTKDDRLNGLITLYNEQEPGQLLNEMHSILGTEFRGLAPALEAYYQQYFSDRSKIVSYSEAYEAIFTDSRNRIADYDAQLESLQSQISSNTTLIDQQKSSLATQNSQLDALRSSNPSAYNKAVPEYNASVRTYNTLVNKTKTLVSQYNSIVQARNGEVAAQNDLYHSLDSNYQSVPTN